MAKLKPILWALLGLILIIGIVGGIKFSQIKLLMASGEQFAPPPEAVNATTVVEQAWPDVYTAIGSVEADQGITVVAEIAGKVQRLAVNSGARVAQGDVLVEQENSNELAQLNAALSRQRLANSNLRRVRELIKNNSISRSDLDAAAEQVETIKSEVDDLTATLDKKVIRAPFAGQLGIIQVDPGEFLQPGTVIASLQSAQQVKVAFPVPQAKLGDFKVGLPVSILLDDQQREDLSGEVTAIGAEVNPLTRNGEVEARFDNPGGLLIPGMSVEVRVELGEPQPNLVVPTTAILFAPYGDTVFLVAEDETGKLIARQQFVRLGSSRGDFTAILDGVKAGDQIINAGAFKLFNGQAIKLSELAPPEFETQPEPRDN